MRCAGVSIFSASRFGIEMPKVCSTAITISTVSSPIFLENSCILFPRTFPGSVFPPLCLSVFPESRNRILQGRDISRTIAPSSTSWPVVLLCLRTWLLCFYIRCSYHDCPDAQTAEHNRDQDHRHSEHLVRCAGVDLAAMAGVKGSQALPWPHRGKGKVHACGDVTGGDG